MKPKRSLRLAALAGVSLMAATTARAELFGGVDFPQGGISFVRLTDVLAEGGAGNGGTVGADIDAVGAISTRRPTAAVPEPTTWALMIGGFGLVGATLRRRVVVRA